jgi:hypothetical protein
MSTEKDMRSQLRRQKGVRELCDIDTTMEFRLAFHPPAWVVASIHPAVVVAETFDAADALAAELALQGHPALAAESRLKGKGGEAEARRIEEIIKAARALAHFTGGRTLDMHAIGKAADAAKTAYTLERGYFDGFYNEQERQRQ